MVGSFWKRAASPRSVFKCSVHKPYLIPKIQNKIKLYRISDSRETKYGKHHRSEVCLEPNDAQRDSLHESDAEISELESEILALKVEGKKLLNIKWNVSSLFFKNIEDSTTLIPPNPNDPEKTEPFWAQAYH